jgi:NADH-quinone oxidoreductase subunit M
MIVLAGVGILYGACLALVQRDFWRLLAFAALGHLSLIVMGVYGLTFTGADGAIYQVLNNELIDAALFVLFGALELRYATSQIASFGGLAAKVPQIATLFVISSLAMIGLPMLNGFIGEFLILSSTFAGVSQAWAAVATVGVILSAAYMLWLVQRLFYGEASAMASSHPAADLRFGESAILWPFAILMLVMGIAPSLWMSGIESRSGPPVSQSATQVKHAGAVVAMDEGGRR